MKLNKNMIISFIVVIGCTFLFNYSFNRQTVINNFLSTYVSSDLAVASVNQIYVSNYSELSNAINTVNKTTTQYEIILTSNIKLNSYMQIGTAGSATIPNVILNLQSYYITSTEYDYSVSGFGTYKVEYALKNYGNLEIKSTTGGIHTTSTHKDTMSDMVIVNYKNMTINGGNYYDGATVGAGQVINNYGKLTINNGTFTLKKSASVILANEGEFTLNNGTFNFTNLEGDNYESFINKTSGIMTINGGNITGGGYGIVNYSKLNINGGNIIGNTAAICNGEPTSSNYDSNSILKITGGNITTEAKGSSGSDREAIYNSGNVTIDNGEFKIVNIRDDVRVSILYNYGIQTINGGTFVAETSRNDGYIYGIRNLSNNSYTNLNGGTIKLKCSNTDQISSLNTFLYGTTNVAENLNALIKSDGNYKFIKLVDTSGYFSSNEGDGSAENPYQISSVEQLDAIRYFPDKNFILMNDLNLEYDTTNENGMFYNDGLGWDPIGDWDGIANGNDTRFEGVFDGNYHKIMNLNINRPNESDIGLFSEIVTDGQVLNLAMVGGNIIGNNSVGSISGTVYGEINRVYTANNVQGNSSVGGIVSGGSGIRIYNSFNLGNVTADSYAGGISSSNCYFCYNTGIIVGNSRVGSIHSSSRFLNYNMVMKREQITNVYSIKDISNISSELSNYWDNSIWESKMVDGIQRLPILKNFDFEYIDSIELLDKKVKLTVGDKIKYQVNPINNYNTNAAFVSNDENIVTFEDNGVISSLNDGNTTVSIYSLYDGYVKTFPVQVENNELSLEMKYEVTYNTNNEKQEVTYGEEYGELQIPTKKGYQFEGWYLEETFDTKVTEDTIVTKAEDHILYAKWEKASYKLTINPNGGEYSGEKEISIKYTNDITLEEPTRIGYTFKGWEITGEESTIEDNKFTMGISDSTLTAKWEGKKYEVTYNTNSEKQEVTYGEEYGKLQIPTKKGYQFEGWYLEENFNTKVTKDTKVTKAEDHTLYAKWEKASYKLTINPNGGEYAYEDELTVNYNEEITLEEPTRVGYTFKGWEITGEESAIEDNKFTMGISDSTLKAKWELIIPNIEATSEYVLKNNMITNIPLETNINEFNLALDDIYTQKIVSTKEKEFLGTGDKLQIYLNDTLVVEYTVVVKGDVSGDGKISVADYSKAYQYYKKRITMEEWFVESADIIEKDSELTMAEISKLYQYVKNRINSLD